MFIFSKVIYMWPRVQEMKQRSVALPVHSKWYDVSNVLIQLLFRNALRLQGKQIVKLYELDGLLLLIFL